MKPWECQVSTDWVVELTRLEYENVPNEVYPWGCVKEHPNGHCFVEFVTYTGRTVGYVISNTEAQALRKRSADHFVKPTA